MFESFSTLALAYETHALAADVTPQNALEGTWIGGLQEWVDGLPDALQWLGIIAIAAIPFIESYSAPFLGVLLGMSWWSALIAGVVGNTAAVAVLTYGAHGIRSALLRKKNGEPTEKQRARREKTKKYLDRFGVPGVAILGPFALPSQFTAPLLVSFGASKHLVMIWMFVSIVLWGVLSVLLGVGLLALLS